jgi:hypothetical protein
MFDFGILPLLYGFSLTFAFSFSRNAKTSRGITCFSFALLLVIDLYTTLHYTTLHYSLPKVE